MTQNFSRVVVALTLGAGVVMADLPTTVHPGFTIDSVKIGGDISTMGLGWMSNGDLALATCQSSGDYSLGWWPAKNTDAAIYIVSNMSTTPTRRKIVDMLIQPSGLVVVNDTIYFADRDGFYRVNSLSPTTTAANKTLVLAIPTAVNPNNNIDNWHQWLFCPFFYNGKFYAPYAGTIIQGGHSSVGQSSIYSGAFLSWTKEGIGGFTKIAGGLRSPNGAGLGANGMMLVSDNEGSWMPTSTLSMMKPNKFYGHRNSPDNWAGAANTAGTLPYEPPVMYLSYDDGIGRSPSQPLYLDRGPYAGDWVMADINSPGGLARINLDNVNNSGNYQGSLMFFTGGISAPISNGEIKSTNPAINRMILHPTQNTIYAGSLGFVNGNWTKSVSRPFYRIAMPNSNTSFEILAIRSRAGGFEIEFSQSINPSTVIASGITLKMLQMLRQTDYGAGRTNGITPPAIGSLQFSNDNKRIYVPVANSANIDRLIKITLSSGLLSATGNALIYNQAWLTHNYQSTVPFNPASTAIANREIARLKSHLTHYQHTPGQLKVKVDLKGNYSISLRNLNGVQLETRSGTGASQFNFSAPNHGLYILQVRQGNVSYGEPVAL